MFKIIIQFGVRWFTLWTLYENCDSDDERINVSYCLLFKNYAIEEHEDYVISPMDLAAQHHLKTPIS